MELIKDLVTEFFRTVYNVPELIRLGGLLGLVVVVFAETGLMVGFFLPGDSLLVTAGLFAAKGDLDIVWLNVALIAAAILGDATGYWIGYRTGKALYSRPNSFFFRRQHLIKTHEFYERHGGKTIVIARFMPIIRTFAPVVAGAAEMTYRRFATYNVAGRDRLGPEHDPDRLLPRPRRARSREAHPHRGGGGDLPLAAPRPHRLAAREDAGPDRPGGAGDRGVVSPPPQIGLAPGGTATRMRPSAQVPASKTKAALPASAPRAAFGRRKETSQ